MKKRYIIDTNVILRFLLKDHPSHHQKAKKVFKKAEKKEIVLILIPQVIFEIDYVLRGVYSLTKEKRVKLMTNLVSSPTLDVPNRNLILKVLKHYQVINVDLVDLYIYELSISMGVNTLSFDQDFLKIKKKLV